MGMFRSRDAFRQLRAPGDRVARLPLAGSWPATTERGCGRQWQHPDVPGPDIFQSFQRPAQQRLALSPLREVVPTLASLVKKPASVGMIRVGPEPSEGFERFKFPPRVFPAS